MCSGARAQRFLFLHLKALLLQAIRALIQIHVLQQTAMTPPLLHELLSTCFSISATAQKYLLLVVYGVVQLGIGLRELCLAAVLRGSDRIIWAEYGVLPFHGNGLQE